MPRSLNIYLAGGMGSLSFEEQTRWRNQVRDEILYGGHDYNAKPYFFSPPEFYNFEEPSHETEKEVMNFDLNRLRNSDLIIVNFNDKSSLGTMAEIAIAYENRIPIVGLNVGNESLHPWQVEMCDRVFNDMLKMVEFIVEFHLM